MIQRQIWACPILRQTQRKETPKFHKMSTWVRQWSLSWTCLVEKKWLETAINCWIRWVYKNLDPNVGCPPWRSFDLPALPCSLFWHASTERCSTSDGKTYRTGGPGWCIHMYPCFPVEGLWFSTVFYICLWFLDFFKQTRHLCLQRQSQVFHRTSCYFRSLTETGVLYP